METIPPSNRPIFDSKHHKPLHHHHLDSDFHGGSHYNKTSFNHHSHYINEPYKDHNARFVHHGPLRTETYPSNLYSHNFHYSSPQYRYTAPSDRIEYHSFPLKRFEYEPDPILDYRSRSHSADASMRRSMHESVKSESFIEYVPFEKKYIEHVPVERVEYVPVEKSVQDYCLLEKQVEYVPVSRYETTLRHVPQQVVDHIPHKYVEYIPVKRQDLVPVNRVQEKVEYQPIDKTIIHYPRVEGQFVEDANKSGRIRNDLAGIYQPNLNTVYQQQWNYPNNNFLNSSSSYLGNGLDSGYSLGYSSGYNVNYYNNNPQYPMYGGNYQYNNMNQYQYPPYYNNNYQMPYSRNHGLETKLNSSGKVKKNSDLDDLKKKLEHDKY